MDERHLRINASLEAVSQAVSFIYTLALESGLEARAAHQCCLCVDEACTNIIEHGYQINHQMGVIDLFCWHKSRTFTIVLVDDSHPYNPLYHRDEITERQEDETGGWGVLLIRRLVDEVAYTRDGNRNCLLMTKTIPVGGTRAR